MEFPQGTYMYRLSCFVCARVCMCVCVSSVLFLSSSSSSSSAGLVLKRNRLCGFFSAGRRSLCMCNVRIFSPLGLYLLLSSVRRPPPLLLPLPPREWVNNIIARV